VGNTLQTSLYVTVK